MTGFSTDRRPDRADHPSSDRVDLSLDRSDMLGWLADYPRQLRALYPAGRKAGVAAAGPASGHGGARGASRFASCLILGTGGGSAAAAYVTSALTRLRLGVPFAVAQGYDLPAFAASALVLAVSHSGDTEETVSSFSQLAQPAGGVSAGRVIISGGGKLAAKARESGLPLVELPTGMQARAVFPGILAAILGVLDGAGLSAAPFEKEIEEAASLAGELATVWGPEATSRPGLAAVRPGPAASPGPAGFAATAASMVAAPLDLARHVRDRLLLIYGGPGATEGVARRWKNQMAECGKTLAHWYTIPEAHHDEVVGWDAPADIREHLFAVLLRDPEGEWPRIGKRLAATRRLLAEKVLDPGRVVEVAARGRSPLARAVSLCLFGDYLSCYVALLRGIDPTPVPIIVSLKEEMARG